MHTSESAHPTESYTRQNLEKDFLKMEFKFSYGFRIVSFDR